MHDSNVIQLGVAVCMQGHTVPFEVFRTQAGLDTRPARCPECKALWSRLEFPKPGETS